MSDDTTNFGAIDAYERGAVSVISDDPKSYLFSNMFDVAARSRPYERVAGVSGWYTCAHNEFVTCLDHRSEVRSACRAGLRA